MAGSVRLRRAGLTAAVVAVAIFAAVVIYKVRFEPTRILVVNALPAQAAELVLNNDSRRIEVAVSSMEDAHDFSDYDAVLLFGRGLYLDSLQVAELEEAAGRGVPVFTGRQRRQAFAPQYNIDDRQALILMDYFTNPCSANYRNLLRFIAAIASPRRFDIDGIAGAVKLPDEMFYHVEPGRYFTAVTELERYLREKGLYHEGAPRVAFVAGVSFPVEGNRAHIDTLINRITAAGYNVVPVVASGRARARLLREVNPAAVVYMPMGRLGSDDLIDDLYDSGVPLFMPFPLTQTTDEWLDVDKPLSAGTLTARVVVPEIDGGMTPLCIATQNPNAAGVPVYEPVSERIDAFMEQFTRFMALRTKPNSQKRIAIAYYKMPGHDAMVASGMEVVPSLYNFLRRLKREGYDVSGLPSTLEAFNREIMTRGAVMGEYAPAAQERFMDTAHPIWVNSRDYEQWAARVLQPEKYREVTQRYGAFPGSLLSRGDSVAIAAVRYGNVLLFPQPRPALGDDDFKLVHGADVAPPHSYIAPYLYVQCRFDADALIHFGTHGNLEFTPGKNAGLSRADWADVLTGNRPHFYFYTTANIGEAVIAKRRSHAVLLSHLTPPYVESGVRGMYSELIERIHEGLSVPSKNDVALKRKIVASGIHKDLGLDSALTRAYTHDELSRVDAFVEELANEKVTGAFYVLGERYAPEDVLTTMVAISADKVAYERARASRDRGVITTEQLQDYGFVAHRYLAAAKRDLLAALRSKAPDTSAMEPAIRDALVCRDRLTASTDAEFDAMTGALSGRPVRPAPGGDPVLSPNVLPTGRNMFSINAEATPSEKAWADGTMLAERTLADYKTEHGDYPRKVSFTFWAGEFISTQGATVAQALRMLGVEPVRDGQGRVIDLRLIPAEELGRPRVDVMVQVSGQLRDIADSRLKMLTDAVRLASQAAAGDWSNYVAEGTLSQEKSLVNSGVSPKRARELSMMRVFGPVNSGYSTGMLHYTENSGEWTDRKELADGFVNNMCAVYGDDDNWGAAVPELFTAAISGTDVIVQPRQSNTWGPLSLDHVYEFTGGLSLAATQINGREPDAVMADYRNANMPRMQRTKEALAVEVRATVLNPTFIRERMSGGASTAGAFGEMFRNVFGWSVTRQSALNEDIYDDLYSVYVADCHSLGIKDYFDRTNPAAMQEMTATMLECARKGYWQASPEQLEATARLHGELTARHGAPCTEFVCGNEALQQFVAQQLGGDAGESYVKSMAEATAMPDGGRVMRRHEDAAEMSRAGGGVTAAVVIVAVALAAVAAVVIIRRRRRGV